MVHQLYGYVILAIIIVFIFVVNTINLKKNRAIHSRAVMLHLKAKHDEDPEAYSAEDLASAVRIYNLNAEAFNRSISSGFGAMLNALLRYPLFEIYPEE